MLLLTLLAIGAALYGIFEAPLVHIASGAGVVQLTNVIPFHLGGLG